MNCSHGVVSDDSLLGRISNIGPGNSISVTRNTSSTASAPQPISWRATISDWNTIAGRAAASGCAARASMCSA